MEVVSPSRIHSLESQRVRIIVHTSDTKTEEQILEHVYPFETLYMVKQRLAITHPNEATWLPNRVFLAEEIASAAAESQYRPLEFRWQFAETLRDPFSLRGEASKELFADGSQKAVFATTFSGITLETVMPAKERTIHAWTVGSILKSLRIDAPTSLSDKLVGGFLQLYFPTLLRKEIEATLTKLSKEDTTAFEVIQNYIESLDLRYRKLDAGLAKLTAELPVLHELRALKFALPIHAVYGRGALELKFYEMKPSETIPFLRFFQIQDKTAPIIKFNTASHGILREKRVLNALLAEQPSTENGAVILLKAPILNARAPLGTAWTLRIYEDGSAELYIGAPRRDAPLQSSVLTEAFRLLPAFLADTPWKTNRDAKLTELTALYEFKTPIEDDKGKPSRQELRKRVDAFLPMFYEEKSLPGEVAAVTLRYKTVSNYTPDTNPVVAYITSLYLRDATQSVSEAPVQMYIASLAREFGIPPNEASELVQDWLRRQSEHVTANNATVPTYNLGTAVSLINNHPKYLFGVAACESIHDLSRILSLMTLMVTENSAVLGAATEEAEVAEPVVEEPVAENAPPADNFSDLMFEMSTTGNEHANSVDEEPKAPNIIGDDEVLPKIGDEWYLERLRSHDRELFDYKATDARTILYSRACQRSSNKQPNVLSKQAYQRAKTLYGDAVFWLEAPLPAVDRIAIEYAATATKERKRKGFLNKKSVVEISEYEKHALELGFPIKGDQSVLTLEKRPDAAAIKEVHDLIVIQQSKPLWNVVRIGTKENHPNYYICSEFWCVRDDLPLIPSEFHGITFRDGKSKPADTCPFCGGRKVRNENAPGTAETVLERRPTDTKVAKYAGFQKTLHHPDRFPLPCCFTDPNNLRPPEGATIPGDVEEEEEAPEVVVAVTDLENRDRPFSSVSKKGSAQNRWYIPNQNVLGRKTMDWFELEKGAVGIPPASVNELLGQSPEDFLTKNKGVASEKINSYLTVPATAFIRYGLGAKVRDAGQNVLSLIAYAKYATDQFIAPDDKQTIPSNTEVIESMFGEKEIECIHAFTQANYGTLLHEFSTPGYELTQLYTEEQFRTWCGHLGIRLPEQRAYAVNLFMSWHNFKNYVSDTKQPKDLELWEMLLATPGLLTRTGCLIVKIQLSRDGVATIACPRFGVSVRSQQERPPFLFLLEDMKTGLYDPLVLYEGVTKDSKRVMGVLSGDAYAFGLLSPKTREALQGFIAQYVSTTEGCGRASSPIHPWIPVREHRRLPRLGELVESREALTEIEISLDGLIRDRSNRLVGVLANLRRPRTVPQPLYLPCLDDGTIVTTLPSVSGEESLPKPDMDVLFDALVGKQKRVGENRLAKKFPGLQPRRLMFKNDAYVAVELDCGATVPISPRPMSNEVAFPAQQEARKTHAEIKDDFPWDIDIALLGPLAEEKRETVDSTSEEVLNEAYQHLRISFSNWLHSGDGRHVRKQIELLRQARKRLPLYELQKRLDILLTPIVSGWLTREGKSTNMILRRDCLQIRAEDKCVGGCSWSEGRCLIHTTDTERYVNPERVMTARLTDELLRTFGAAMEILEQKVSHLKPLDPSAVLREDDALLFSATGRGSTALYDKLGYSTRKPGEFTQGLVFPEEVGLPMLEVRGALPVDWDILEPLVTPADIGRDRKALLDVAIVTVTGSSLATIERGLGRALRGTKSDWEYIARAFSLNVITTQWNEAEHRLEPQERIRAQPIAGAGGIEPSYVVLDMNGIPLQRKGTGVLTHARLELPGTLRLWLDRV
jgi:hypothetical protein